VLALAVVLAVVAAGSVPAGAARGRVSAEVGKIRSPGGGDLDGGSRAPALTVSSSAGSGTPLLGLAGQSPWVTPDQAGAASFTLAVTTAKGVPADDEVMATLYPKLTTRSGFEQTLTRVPGGRPLDRTHPVALSSLTPTDGGEGLSISILPGNAANPPSGGAPTLDLTCTSTTPSRCTGVYPLEVSLAHPASGGATPAPVSHAHFTTYLTYSANPSSDRLGFAMVMPFSSPAATRTVDGSGGSSGTLSSGTVTALSGLSNSLAAHPAVAATVAASPATLQALARSGRGVGSQAVQTLAAMSAGGQTSRQFLAQPYVPVDLGALAGAGEGEEITAQMREGAAVLQSLGVETATPLGTWVATGAVGSDLQSGLSAKGLGATSLVLPDVDLALPPSNAGTWSSAFTLSFGGKGTPTTAAASDSELAAHFTADPADPVLEANQLLADLAMIHFEEPNTPTPRAVVAVPPSGWTPTKAFDTALLAGLTTNPTVKTTTLDGYFSTFQDSGSSLPGRRLVSGGTGPVLAPSLAASITAQRLRLTAFDSSVRGNVAVLTGLDQQLLAAESDDLSPPHQTSGVADFARALDGQLSLVQLATERTITLTANSGLIPVTMVSAAPYTVVGVLTLSGGRFEFPHGSSQQLRLDHSTTPVRIDVEARTSGDLPLEVTFDSPDGNLVIASGRLTVRSTATSLVGVVITALALLVLLGWWVRTWRRGRHRVTRGASPPDA
jgi:Family of unknown function (DUF6049)